MFGVRSCCFGVLLLIGEALSEDRVIIDTIEDFNNSTGVENFDVDTMTMEDEAAFNKVNVGITDNITDDIAMTDNDENTTMLVEEMCGNSSLLEHMMNVTKDRGIVHGFSESITVILVSEIGDKTFFIAAILAMRNNKLTVFLAAVSALFLMTVLSGLMGWVVTTFIPREYTYYTCTAIMFAFGLKMLWEAWRMDDNEAEEVQKEVEQELAEMDGTSPPNHQEAAERGEADGTDRAATNGTVRAATNGGQANVGFESELQGAAQETPAVLQVETLEQEAQETQKNIPVPKARKEGWMDNVIDNSCRENSWFGKKCLLIFKLFVNCFTMTFIAEWGDRSQLATIVLAGLNDVWGVILGGCLGHAICTGGAVLVGTLIAKFISPRKITFIGALVFLGFAIASIFTDPNEDGIDGIPEIPGYDNCTRMLNHNISQTLELEEEEMEMTEY
eukprot:TRINITY_DN4444_c0_g1_i1.p1 TRINITY_DN4444_c0_g1~~TRINITY_DN4444_c0_g1_i1.p1  ORF type:complete len:446 (-),score=155.72 TRINITY_DN4444_c0_g1_i1:448-1785(-)